MTDTLFETERLRARPLTDGDAEACFALYGDPDVTRYVTPGGATVPSLDIVRYLLRDGMLAPRSDPRFGFWALERREDAAIVGTVALVEVEGSEGEHEIGWHLAQAHWGRGYATESGRALLRYGFDGVGLDRILALVHPENRRSARVCERIGMQPAGARMHQGYEHVCFAVERARP